MNSAAPGPINPSSLAEVFWRVPAPISYIALCVVTLAILYQTPKILNERVAEKLVPLRHLEVEAAKVKDARLQVELIQERDKVIVEHDRLTTFVKVSFWLVALGMVVAVVRVATHPNSSGQLEWCFSRLLFISLGAQIIALIFAGACVVMLQ